MPRREIRFVTHSYYHLYNRGNNRQAIFFQPENYEYFLKGVWKYTRPVLEIVAFCLMPTHYHLLVQVRATQTSEVFKTSEVSRAMQRLLISYTKAINRRYSRVGSLFQGQFQAKPVYTLAHLLNLCPYIHANPVKDGLTSAPEDWLYSDYLEWMAAREAGLPRAQFIQEYFGSPGEYAELVRDHARRSLLPEAFVPFVQD